MNLSRRLQAESIRSGTPLPDPADRPGTDDRDVDPGRVGIVTDINHPHFRRVIRTASPV